MAGYSLYPSKSSYINLAQSSSRRMATPHPHHDADPQRRTPKPEPRVTSGPARPRDFYTRYPTHSQRDPATDSLDHVSDLSGNLSVNLDHDDAAPPPPEIVRRRPLTGQHRDRSVHSALSRRADSDSRHTSPDSREPTSTADSKETYLTRATSTSTLTLPPLQTKGLPDGEQLEPLLEDDPASYDLVQPGEDVRPAKAYSLETRGEQMFSKEHLQMIFRDPKLLLKFTSYLGAHRAPSVPTLIYYLDALKALRAIRYANAVADALDPLEGIEFTRTAVPSTHNAVLEAKASQAFDLLVREDLPAYIAHIYVQVVSTSIQKRITGRLPPHLREASEGLAEVFCLSDPSRTDNPIVFASEEFHRTTQYGVSYAIGRNCRFLQGPRTNPASVRRLGDAVRAGKELCECIVNYRRDGSSFMNLLMIAPLRDSRGVLRYYIGAQVDVSGLAKECTDLEGLQRMLADDEEGFGDHEKKDEFQELSEMFNVAELDIVRKYGGSMHREHVDEDDDTNPTWHRPRLLLKDSSPDHDEDRETKRQNAPSAVHGKLSGVYQHYLLVRPYPSLRILFASPSLRVPGILQSPFMNRIGSSERVREELVAALAEGRGVTAKIRWVSRNDEEGRNRWIHCTPLLGHNGNIGVWMVILVDDESSHGTRKFRQAPPVATHIERSGDHGASPVAGPLRPKTSNSTRSVRLDTALSTHAQTPRSGTASRADYDYA